METIRLTMAQALVKFLDQQYVEFDGVEQRFIKGVFTIFGHGNVLGLGQALEEDCGGLEVYQGRNEQGMAQAAVAFAKQTRRKQICACTSSVGPGAANMVTAAATATANQIPVLLLPGDTFASRQPDPVLQQIEQQHDFTISTNDAFRPVSKYWDRIVRPEQLMTALIQAMRVLTNPADTGAVTLALPQDVQGEAYDYPVSFFEKRVHRIDRRPASAAQLEDAVRLIARKRKPLLICGGGVRYSEAGEALAAFAEAFHIPFAETQAGKSAVASSHPLNLGGIGVTGNSAANAIAKDADLIIGVGTRFTDFTTGSKELFGNPDMDVVTVNVSEFQAIKLDATPIVADAKVGLEELHQRLQSLGYRSAYIGEIQEARDAWDKEWQRLAGIHYVEGTGAFTPEIEGHLDEALPEYAEALGSCLTQTQVVAALNQLLDDNAIVVGAAGSLPGDLQRMWRAETTHSYHMEYGYSCMGYEIAGALGVKMAEPEREVYAFTGDGSYLMLHSELLTSIQEGRKINVLLFDNNGFGCINNLQMGNGMGSFGTEFRSRNPHTGKLDGPLVSIDFALSASGYGAVTYSVRTMKELEQAVMAAKRQKESTLIDIKVLPKTMTHGYDAWWNVGVAEVSGKKAIAQAYDERRQFLSQARPY
ncbi:3D-(3,5/4)-trihydroxycyclohexane-1,2-dione acylhydrolase (decyclizing) [Paenibacillus alvei]|uniref:3D-(3,5/4)-trihydroxycyclohexane-1,2-dione hydrolase n=1 Tax=Paenibacillus alvei TaxID=44250 RepID=A0ABT4GXL0_PAEAL|nr:3D-(3,5/4)-trihydroxycyclohexane-1,2-dione acylhydrolase (decyclizing) [Paenibacillus alvei]EJW19441.1 3D-(3,5/4)-trihydroxycyclohexane-1,2-dione hydrolase [Paenibacillus alvei DSM 29]MCY9543305.1 3D-(3,5/4)-trihydroxycyclohexane-1,2-dione acylhydrolase (decyclizing) [Paenibacillus alvei]MCY9702825.1 3D-(3,5/4)-trihydroxycyclohexane-1,2-dione acylhydrolase (decyclizing) [Paenibacillus alvei]MCY9736972.1 3D-(3,5/4)-trihydroxycyclohexane-1,2-dione acylhydrolase (decyclizing) [Paenibacillus alv